MGVARDLVDPLEADLVNPLDPHVVDVELV